jgi:hypothetical protein
LATVDRRLQIPHNRRIVLEVGHPAAVRAHVRLDQIAVVVDLHDILGGAHIDLLAEQAPGHGVEALADLDVDTDAIRTAIRTGTDMQQQYLARLRTDG